MNISTIQEPFVSTQLHKKVTERPVSVESRKESLAKKEETNAPELAPQDSSQVLPKTLETQTKISEIVLEPIETASKSEPDTRIELPPKSPTNSQLQQPIVLTKSTSQESIKEKSSKFKLFKSGSKEIPIEGKLSKASSIEENSESQKKSMNPFSKLKKSTDNLIKESEKIEEKPTMPNPISNQEEKKLKVKPFFLMTIRVTKR
jgi:hypothetical protein